MPPQHSTWSKVSSATRFATSTYAPSPFPTLLSLLTPLSFRLPVKTAPRSPPQIRRRRPRRQRLDFGVVQDAAEGGVGRDGASV